MNNYFVSKDVAVEVTVVHRKAPYYMMFLTHATLGPDYMEASWPGSRAGSVNGLARQVT